MKSQRQKDTKKPTIVEVATLAGVSLGTASNALRNARGVREQTRKRVLEAARKLKYIPNQAARTLRSEKSQLLGLIVPSILNPYYGNIARHMELYAQERGLALMVCSTDRNRTLEAQFIRVFREKNVDGIVWFARDMGAAELISRSGGSIPVISSESDIQDVPGDCIVVDNFGGAGQAADHLVDLGHRNIAVIGPPADAGRAENLVPGFNAKLVERGIVPKVGLFREGDYEINGGYEAMRDILAQSPGVTAVFTANDMMAFGAMKAIRAQKLHIPDDISIVSFDDIPFAQYFDPPLTTVRIPSEEIGKLAVEMIVTRIREPDLARRIETVSASLVVRESTRAIR